MKHLQIVAVLVLSLAAPVAAELEPEFQALCQRLSEGDSGFFSLSRLEPLEAQVEKAGGDELVRILRQGRLAYELMRFGRSADAVELLTSALDTAATREDLDREILISLNFHLGIAHLQVGEEQNCIANHTAASCILPIRPQGVHQAPEPSRLAAAAFQTVLGLDPENSTARWLLNLAQTLAGNYPLGVPESLRWQLPSPEATPEPEWTDFGTQLGVDPSDLAGGAIVDDFDGDGLLDIVSSSWDPCAPFKAYRNLGAAGFEDVSDRWGLSAQSGSLTLRHADYDGDGRIDLLALRGAWLGEEGRIRKSLLRNEIDGKTGGFVDVTAAAGLAYPAFPTQAAAWADYDLDGDLDLYVGNEATATSVDPLQLLGMEGNPFPSQLFRNNGDGGFTDVARVAGVANRRFAKSVAWGDYDSDGDPDLYVSNLGPNRLYRNNGNGTFSDVALEAGVEEPVIESFASWFFDHDNDGDLDLFVSSYSAQVKDVSAAYLGDRSSESGHPVLYRNNGDATFTDVSAEVGITQPLLIMGADFGDFDGDGWLDVYLGTGMPEVDAVMPNVLYRNIGGDRFEDVTFSHGLGHLQKGHSVAFADIDNDGQQEIYEQLGGAHLFDRYSNALFDAPGRSAHWVNLRLESAGRNRFAVGARIEVRLATSAGERSIFRTVGYGSSFGGSSLQAEIGLGDDSNILWIAVLWPASRNVQRFEDVLPDATYRVVEGDPVLHELHLPSFPLGTSDTETPHSPHHPN